jgi:signal transduction histidine kinase
MTGMSQQIKRIESRDAEIACSSFTDILKNASQRVKNILEYVADSRDFHLMELGRNSRSGIDQQYSLPLMSLDFIEYLNTDGVVVLSGNRPALVGQESRNVPDPSSTECKDYWLYENDLKGSHPSLVLIMPTINGYLSGGIFLDGPFMKLASAVTKSRLIFVDSRDRDGTIPDDGQQSEVGLPYRSQEELYAVLSDEPDGQFYIIGHFHPTKQKALFSNFITAIIAVTAFSLIIAIPSGLYFSSRTRREIDNLTSGAMRVASGDFSLPVISTGAGEFSDLADSFNHMMKQLTDYRERLIMTEKIAAWQTIGRKVAHEVKNPLTPIAIAADDLKRSFIEHKSDFSNILESSTATIKNEVSRMQKLIDQFSSFAKMPAPEIIKVRVDEFADELSILFKDDLSRDRLVIENKVTASQIQIDPDQIRQVLLNLINNSIEAGCTGCTLRLSQDEGNLKISVEDDGPGFPDKLLNYGITPYYSTKESGSGLGLVICQRIVFDHEGTMMIVNKSKGGARVMIALPQKNA